MEFEFSNKDLIKLYATGKCKKLKFLNAKAVDNFLDCVQRIDAAESIYDWWKKSSLNFENLEGYENKFSMRIDKKHRLEFEINFEDTEKTKGYVTILKISQHYK